MLQKPFPQLLVKKKSTKTNLHIQVGLMIMLLKI